MVEFSTNPIPFDDDNFLGLSATVPIWRFQINANTHFAFDEVIWHPVPEPSGWLLVALGALRVLTLSGKVRHVHRR